MAAGVIGYDLTFELNEFGQPKLRSEIEVIKDAILFILFATPGQYPSLPTIGIDIQSLLYSRYEEIDVDSLKQKIIQQCNAVGVYFNNGSVAIRKTKYKGEPSLLIHIAGKESYPNGYLSDPNKNSEEYLIGITYDELHKMIYNISSVTPKSK